MEILSKKDYEKRKSFKLFLGKMPFLSSRSIKYKVLVTNSKKVLKPDFGLFPKFLIWKDFGLKKFLKKNNFFFNLKSFQIFLQKNYSNSRKTKCYFYNFSPKKHG